jgi:methyl coenzyme M reductase subunit D
MVHTTIDRITIYFFTYGFRRGQRLDNNPVVTDTMVVPNDIFDRDAKFLGIVFILFFFAISIFLVFDCFLSMY